MWVPAFFDGEGPMPLGETFAALGRILLGYVVIVVCLFAGLLMLTRAAAKTRGRL